MIVLINEAQHRRLTELEKQRDKFDREVDSGVTKIKANFELPALSGSIPEPSTTLLLLISSLFAIGVRRR